MWWYYALLNFREGNKQQNEEEGRISRSECVVSTEQYHNSLAFFKTKIYFTTSTRILFSSHLPTLQTVFRREFLCFLQECTALTIKHRSNKCKKERLMRWHYNNKKEHRLCVGNQVEPRVVNSTPYHLVSSEP